MTLAALPAHGRSDSGTGNSPSSGVKPDMPNGLSLSVTNVDADTAEVTAEWNSVGDAAVYEWDSAYDTGENPETGEVGPPTSNITFQMPRSGGAEECYFCVSARNDAGDGEQRCDGYTLDAQDTSSAPTAPSDLTATAGDGYVELAWTDNSTDESGFRIYRDGTEIADSPVGADVTSYTDDGRTNGTEYCYEVSAYNSSGESAKAGPACATPQDSGATPTAAVTEDFQEFTSDSDLYAGNANLWMFNEDGCATVPCIELDQNEGVPDLGTSQSVKYNHGDGEKRFGMTLDHPKVWEVWYECWVKFADDFKTDWGDDSGAAAYKFVFGMPEHIENGRFDVVTGLFGGCYKWDAPGDQGSDFESVQDPCNSGKEYDGIWHRYRFHFKHETSDGAADGEMEFWAANESGGRNYYWQETGVPTDRAAGRIQAMALGRNMNHMADQIINLWWGQAKVWTEDPGW